MEPPSKKTKREGSPIHVGILGCTGMVGQKFIELLMDHPYFVIKCLGASEKSVGRKYGDVVNWKQTIQIPSSISEIIVSNCIPAEFQGCRVIFSGLDSSVAGSIEEEFAKAEFAVFSNAKNHRMDPDVPILIPYVNPDHINIIPHQRKKRGYKRGFIVTNANCSTTGLVIALKPLHDRFGVEKVAAFTMQALSGAGYPGIPSLDICDNIIPFIRDEEEKMAIEPRKIFGSLDPSRTAFLEAPLQVSAHCNRVQVTDGHTECLSIQFRAQQPTLEELCATLEAFRCPEEAAALPSAPPDGRVVRIVPGEDRPQPRLDRQSGRGFVVSVGRVRRCSLFHCRMTLLSHNTVIGAAGGSILNAELAKVRGLLEES